MPIDIPTLEEIQEYAREERLDHIEEVSAKAAAEWVEDLQARGLITNSSGVDLAPELRNVHLIAQVAARLRGVVAEKLKFYAEILATAAMQNGGTIKVSRAKLNSRQLGALIEEEDDEYVTLRFIAVKEGSALS